MHALGLLVLGQRGKLRKLEAALDDEVFVMQLLSLRLALILCHARRDPDPKALRITVTGGRFFVVACQGNWSEVYPQSAHLLREEVLAWQKTNWRVDLAGC